MTPDGPGVSGLDLPYMALAYGAAIPALAGLEGLLAEASVLACEVETELSK